MQGDSRLRGRNLRPQRERLRLLASAALGTTLAPVAAHALPAGGQVSAGQAAISSSGSQTTISQSSNRVVIDWQGFNIGSNERVAFSQPSASSIALNRVHDANPSSIEGSLTANGQVWLINPNGIMFGAGAQVNVGGLLATTSDISNSDFMAGHYAFTPGGNPGASVSNAGSITAAQAGLVALVAPSVENSGVITARLGKVQLASGDRYTLDLYGDGLIDLGVSDAVAQQLVANSGTLSADGGRVELSAAAASGVVSGVINMSGVIQARTLGDLTGSVNIDAAGSNLSSEALAQEDAVPPKTGASTVLLSGSIDASGYGSGQKGGSVEVTGDHVALLSGSSIDASGDAGGGYVKVGGDFHGAGTTPTAEATIMQSGSIIRADAVSSGNGGDVALWSDDYTNFAGTIDARGGSQSGNGGFVETSGKQILSMNGLVDASSSHGNAGSWLMDPADVTISTGADSGITGSPDFIPDGSQAEAVLNVSDITTALNAGTNVTVTTGGDALAGTNNGQITVSNAISATTGTGGVTGNLTLSAYSNIVVNGAITLGGAGVTGGNLILDADNAANGSGYIAINSAIATNGGNITLGGGEANPANIVAGTGYATGNAGQAYGIYINNVAVDAGGGNIVANGKGYDTTTNNNYGFYINGSSATLETSGSGTSNIHGIGQGNTNSGSDYGVYVASGGVTSTVDGDLNVTGTGGGAGSGGDGFGVYVTGSGSAIETANGTINTSATGGGAGGGGGINYGIYVNAVGGIKATGVGGNIVLNGTGGDAGGSASSNYGIYVSTGNSITAGGGNISLTGTGGDSSGIANYGVEIYGGTVSTTGNGAITITGTGNGSGASSGDSGVEIVSAGTVSTVDGDISITGTGAGTGNSNFGVHIGNTGTIVEATGSGNVSITGVAGGGGTGANNYGMYLYQGAVSATTGDITMHGTGGNSSGGHDTGIEILGGGSVAATGGNISLTGTAGTGTGSSNQGILLNAGTVSTTGSGAIDIVGTGNGSGSSGSDYGVAIASAGVVSAVNGNVTVTGNDANTGTGGGDDGTQIQNAGSTVKTTGSGDVSVTGTGGGSGNSNSDFGVYAQVANSIQTTGGGAITVTGTGGDNGGSGGSNYGIVVNGSITGSGGAMSINGTGGNSSGNTNVGIYFNGGTISNSGSGTLIINGTGGGDGNSAYDYGVELASGGATSTVDGNLTLTGNGGGTGTVGNDYGFYVTGSGSTIETTGSGALSVTGNGGDPNGTGTHNGDNSDNYGIYVNAAHGIQTTGSGTMTLTGTGGDNGGTGGNGNYDNGIVVDSGNSITGGGGNMTITGKTGATDSGNWSYGIQLNGGTISNTGNGAITITGIEQTTGSNFSMGIRVSGGGVISTVNGNLTVTGNAAIIYWPGNDYGVEVSGNGSAIEATGTGNVSITATGGTAGSLPVNSASDDYAFFLDDHGLVSTTSGSITIAGTGQGGGYSNYGDFICGTIQTTSGNITITGTGSDTGVQSQHGVLIGNNGTTSGLITTVSGAITINGTAGGTDNSYSSVGVVINGGAEISVTGNGGSISVTGAGGGSSSTDYGVSIGSAGGIQTTGTAPITLTGIGANGSPDIMITSAIAPVIGGSSANGDITFNADTLSFTTLPTIQTSQQVLVQPRTTSTSIGVAGGSGTLQVTGGILNNTTAGSIAIGNIHDSGAMNVGAYAWNAPVNLYNGSGSIIINGAQAMKTNSLLAESVSGNIAIGSLGSITSSGFGTPITLAASGGDFLNYAGSFALSTPHGRWLVYSDTPFTDAFDGLHARFVRFGCVYGQACLSIPAGNGYLFSDNPIPEPVTIADATGSFITQEIWRDKPGQAYSGGHWPPRYSLRYCKDEHGRRVCFPM